MTKLILGITALLGLWANLARGAETGRDPSGAATTAPATTAAASQPQSGAAPAGVEEAIREAAKLPPGSRQLLKAFEDALAEWVKKSPAEAFEWAGKQEKVDRGRHYVPLVAMRLWVRNDVQGALAYVEKAPGNRGLGEFASCWAGQDGPAASAWAAKQPKERWPAVINAVGEAWAGHDPKATAGWILTLPPEQGCYGYYMTASMWTWSDQASAAAWVAKLPEGKPRDDAAGVVAINWRRKSPKDAEKIKEWVKGFPMAEAKREQILQQLEKLGEKK